MKWLQRLGRCWAIVTREDQRLNPDRVRAILLIHRPQDTHLTRAITACRRRFPSAPVTIVQLPATGFWRALRVRLREWRTIPHSLLVWLSLEPVTVALGCLEFAGPRLLFNRWGQWFLVRPRTVAEVLTFRRGADRPVPRARLTPRSRLISALAVPWRLIALTGWVGFTLIGIGWRRWRYRRRQAALARVG
jgi:hypothetical protein